jgi:hypothetical protein
MRTFLVTVKLVKNPVHDPKNKITGICPADKWTRCTDVTGAHHTMMYITDDDLTTVEDTTAFFALNFHVTRDEEVTQSLHMRSEE